VPSQDIVLGLYYATRAKVNGKGEGMYLADIKEVQRAYDNGEVELGTKITVRLHEYERIGDNEFRPMFKRFETTVGRALLSEILPKGLPFDLMNRALKKKEIEALGMGALLGVAQGSVNEPRFIIFEYRPENAVNAKPPRVSQV